MAYTPTGQLRDVLDLPHDALRTLHVLECTAQCKCGPVCANRVVQRGSQVPVEIVWDDAVGWGVRGTRNVEKGEFVMQYLGRVVAEDECGGGVEGRIAFFARRDIAAHEPLCFDYEGGGPDLPAGARTTMGDLSFRCRCGSAKCRKIIFPLLSDDSDEDSDEAASDENELSYLSDL
ncbi:hypothetical protein GGF32_002177 [Allomyces javanicus]|nr:hypothetical protein GGF32_002177 [Allomyces javanicus]